MKNYNFQAHSEYISQLWTKAVRDLYLQNNVTLPDLISGDVKTVKSIEIKDREVSANIKTPDNKTYKVKFIFSAASDDLKQQIKETIAAYPSVALDVSLGFLSETLMEVMYERNINIFPQSFNDMRANCSCGKIQFCNQIASVLLAIEKEIAKNPFHIFNMRGITTEELIEASGLQNNFVQKLVANIHTKFVPVENAVFADVETTEDIKTRDYEFPKTETEAVFFMLPENPLFFEKKEFKTKLSDVYQTIESDLESILITEKLPPLRDAGFYPYYADDNSLHVFVTPENSFLYYLKSKGSRVRYSSKSMKVPVFDKETGKIFFEEKFGVSVQADIAFDYFLFLSLAEDREETMSPTARFLINTAALSVEFVKSLEFLPEIVLEGKTSFSMRYVPISEKTDIEPLVNAHKALMPPNFMFKEKNETVLDKRAAFDFLALYMTYIIHKVTFLRASKLKNDTVTGIFTKNRPLNAITSEGKNIALSIAYWLDAISIKKKPYSPIIRVTELESGEEFILAIDVLNAKSNEIYKLSKIFEDNMSNTRMKSDIMGQIVAASNYMPQLKDILDSKGEFEPVIGLKEILEIISKTSIYLNALDIKIVIPKTLKKLISPRISLKARLKNPDNFDIASLFDTENRSNISFEELMNFQYEIAIGDDVISKEEFLQMVKSADGIVKFKDNYVLLKPEEIEAIMERLNSEQPEFMGAMDFLHSAFSGFYNGIDFDAGDAFKRAIDDFLKIDEISIPEGLHGTLRPYQERGFKWLYSNTMRGFGSCMADDMGLGKTIQVISLLLKLKEENKLNKPALVVCPTTLVGNWHKECAKFAPSLKTFIYHGQERHMEFGDSDLVITTYGLLRNDIEQFKDKEWDFVIIDEAQNIKNPDTAQTQAVKSVKTKTYIAMTGTPVENRLNELWSIFDFTNKGYLGSMRNFQQNYATPIEKFRDEERIEKLKQATAPFTLRRLKTDKTIISDLPDKIVFDEYCYLSKEQAALYEKTLENSFKELDKKSGFDRKGHIFKLITSLKQICNHPVQYTKSGTLSKDLSGKAEKAFSIISQIIEQNEKAVIFTQYKEMGDLLVQMMKDEFKIDTPFFHGSVGRTARDEMVEAFQTDDKIKFMIISLKAGGTGLNLTAATNVIHYDLWWNPAVEDQATDRTYRIGQTKNVIVHRLITLGTFEEKIDEMIKGKKELADLTVATGEKMITELSNAELKDIFGLTKF
jgi:SNF2 family DNA or RNA helicase/uncharacterized Zn finger protein